MRIKLTGSWMIRIMEAECIEVLDEAVTYLQLVSSMADHIVSSKCSKPFIDFYKRDLFLENVLFSKFL